MLKKYWISIWLLVFLALVQSFNPIRSAWSAVGYYGSVIYDALPLPCHYNECCGNSWIPANIRDLEKTLAENIYGQHLVKEIVVNAVKGHVRRLSNPRKALTLSFHGWPGSGKNYVSEFIVKSIYKRGMLSKYVHFFSGMIDFPLEREADIYKMHLTDWVRGNVSACERSLFIFDEVDKMSASILDGVKPFLDYHSSISGVDFRKTIFIFLSNTGGSLMTEHMVNLWSEGRKREDLKLRDFEDLLRKGSFNENGGLQKSPLITSNLIDHYVPFLPLEEQHVKLCIQDELRRNNHSYDPSIEQEVLKDLLFGPDPVKLYSLTGCKRISQKVTTLVEKKNFHSEL